MGVISYYDFNHFIQTIFDQLTIFMKQKRHYSEARMEVVQLSGKSQLLSGSPTFEGSSDGSRSLYHGSYEYGGGVF